MSSIVSGRSSFELFDCPAAWGMNPRNNGYSTRFAGRFYGPQNADIGSVIDGVYMFGTGEDVNRLVGQITSDCTVKAEVVDPFAGFTLGPQWEKQSSWDA